MIRQIVVADDSRLARKQLIKLLGSYWDAEVRQASNGREALEAYRAGADLMFLDLTMPEMDGYEVLETLAAEGGSYRVIVVSADVQPKAIDRVTGLGALGFVQKPVDADKLAQVLRQTDLL